MPLAGGTFLQMDQTAPANQEVFVYVLVAILKKRLQLETSLYTILQILSVTIFERIPILQVFSTNEYKTKEGMLYNQLNLFD